MNLVILRGRMGQDPEISYIPTGTQKARLSLATSRRWKDKTTGEAKEQTQWHRIILWDRLAEIAGRYLGKGREVLVTGEIQYRQYTDKEGKPATVTEIQARELEMIGPRDAGDGAAGAGMGQGAAAAGNGMGHGQGQGQGSGPATGAAQRAAGGYGQGHGYAPGAGAGQAPGYAQALDGAAPGYAPGGYASPAGAGTYDDDIPF